jgi:hypothetical protein
LTRQLERTNNTSDAKRSIDIFEPILLFLIGAGSEPSPQFGDEFTTIFGSLNHRVVSGSNNAAKIAQVKFGQIFASGFGTVEPIGDAKTGEKILGHLQDALLGHGWLTFGGKGSVGVFETLTNGLHTLQRQFGNGTLIFGKLRQHCFAIG